MIDLLYIPKLLVAGYGIWLIYHRLRPAQNRKVALVDSSKKVSLIIPARDEEHNLELLFQSIKSQSYTNIEIIGVNDGSQDSTQSILESHCDQVIEIDQNEKAWSGKSWACFQGAKVATGDLLLFIDADIELKKSTIQKAIEFSSENNLSLLSAIPEHSIKTWWDQACAVFHLLIYSSIRPFQPQKNWLYANGQFLMFDHQYYKDSGGHEVIAKFLAEDLALANHCFSSNKNYGVFPRAGLYKVRMYHSLGEFIDGWRRNFFLGMKYSKPQTSLDVFFMLYPLMLLGEPNLIFSYIFLSLALLAVSLRIKDLGKYSGLAIVLYPLGLALFVYVTLLSLKDRLLKAKVKWKGREYAEA